MNSELEDIKRELYHSNILNKELRFSGSKKIEGKIFTDFAASDSDGYYHFFKVSSVILTNKILKYIEDKYENEFDETKCFHITPKEIIELPDLIYLKHSLNEFKSKMLFDLEGFKELASKTYISDWEKEFDDFLKNSPKITWKDIYDNLAD